MKCRWIAVCLMLCLLAGTSCQKHGVSCIMPDNLSLRPGDVVFRRGEGLASRVILAADHNGHYSHTGIVVDSCGILMIVHAVPGEHDYKGDVDRVKLDRPEIFFSSQFATIGEVCRPKDSVVAARAAAIAWQIYQRRILFDHEYDDMDSTRMYCTELIVFAFRRAGYELADTMRHVISLPFLHASCIFPSDIYASDFLKSVIAF